MSDFKVQFYDKIDLRLKFLDANKGLVELCIIDIMMPPGVALGLLTARVAYELGSFSTSALEEKRPFCPIIVLTNRASEELERRVATDERGWLC